MESEKGARAGEIREVALRLLEEEGPAGVSMRRIAREIGITPMAIYHHFRDRDSLLREVTDGEFERLAECFRRAMDETGNVLESAVIGYLDYANSRPNVFDFLFSQQREGARQYPADFVARKSPTFTLIADGIAREMELGTLRTDDVWEVACTLWGLVHGLASLRRGGRIALSDDEFKELCLRALGRLMHGIES